MKIQDRLPRFLREVGTGRVIALVAVILGVGVCVVLGWGWLRSGGGTESNGETLRNVILAVGAMVAIVLAIWRSIVAERQAAAAQQQAVAAQRTLTRDRFHKGVEMIGSSVLSVRLGGIYALDDLAEEYQWYHVQVMRVLCAFVRNPPHAHDAPRPDVQYAVSVIGRQTIQLEKESGYRPDLSHANLRGLKMGQMNFSGCNFEGADLSDATLKCCDLSGAHLDEATLRGTTLDGANLEKASLTEANLTDVKSAVSANFTNAVLQSANLSYANLQGAEFRHSTLDGADLTGTVFIEGGLEAKGLTQKQVAFAKADDNIPPVIDGVPDAKTGQRIQWSARPTIIT